MKLLRDGKELTCDISVDAPSRLIPFHIKVRGRCMAGGGGCCVLVRGAGGGERQEAV